MIPIPDTSIEVIEIYEPLRYNNRYLLLCRKCDMRNEVTPGLLDDEMKIFQKIMEEAERHVCPEVAE